MKRSKVPPLGARPKFVFDNMRIDDLKNAIHRYLAANYPVPYEWVQEYNDLVANLPIEDASDDIDRLLRMKKL